jgi:hypothetical protein
MRDSERGEVGNNAEAYAQPTALSVLYPGGFHAGASTKRRFYGVVDSVHHGGRS